ncbi:MAG: DUF952 domain-containing protein [Anaerolineales bacterium]
MAEPILHLVPAAYFRTQPEESPYAPDGFVIEGFIHCTREAGVLLDIANGIYRDVPGDFLTLVIDPDKVSAPVKYEPPLPTPPPGHPLAQQLFPHIYGPLNRDAILSIRTARRAEDGSFIEV